MDLQRALTADEYHVIYDHFFRQYSIQEIAASHKQMQKDCIREITSLLGNQAIIITYTVTAFQFSGLFRREDGEFCQDVIIIRIIMCHHAMKRFMDF